jgi:hypothetical protein
MIQRSTDGGAWQLIGAVGAKTTFFDDTMASKFHSYSYRVLAYNSTGNSAFSNTSAVVKTNAVQTSLAVIMANGTSSSGNGFLHAVQSRFSSMSAAAGLLSDAVANRVSRTSLGGLSKSLFGLSRRAFAAISNAFWQARGTGETEWNELRGT